MYYKDNSVFQQNILPKESDIFKEELISEILIINSDKPEIERILDILVSPEVIRYKLVNTLVGESNEGQSLSGYKLVVEVQLKEILTYVANEPTQSVYTEQYNIMKSMFVILPTTINGKDTCSFVRADNLEITPYIEAVKYRMLDCRKIHNCIMIFLDVKIC